MTMSEAIRLAAERSCDMRWDAELGLWTVHAISYDGDPVCLSERELLAMSAREFLERAIPQRP